MIKIQSDPKVYAVSANGALREIGSAAVAQQLFGSNWESKIIPVVISVFTQYTIGDSIVSATSYNVVQETNVASSIDVNQKLGQ